MKGIFSSSFLKNNNDMIEKITKHLKQYGFDNFDVNCNDENHYYVDCNVVDSEDIHNRLLDFKNAKVDDNINYHDNNDYATVYIEF